MAKDNSRTQIVTPRGVAGYCTLNTPKVPPWGGDAQYSVNLKLDSSDEKVAEFLKTVNDALDASKAWGVEKLQSDLDSAKDPAKKGALKKKIATLTVAEVPVKPVFDEDGTETNMVEMKFKAKGSFSNKDGEEIPVKIALRDAKRNDIAGAKVGSGSEIKVAALMYPYYNPKDNVVGITFRLQAVQVLKLVEYGAGNGSFGFDDEEGDEIAAPKKDSTGFSDESADESQDF